EAVLHGHSNAVSCLAFDPTGATLASGSVDGTVRLWDAETSTSPRVVRSRPTRAALSADGALAATPAWGEIVRWDLAAGVERWRRPRSRKTIEAIAIDRESKWIAAGGLDRRLWLLAADGSSAEALGELPAAASSIAFARADVVVASADGAVCVVDAATGAIRRRFGGESMRVRRVCTSPDGSLLAGAVAEPSGSVGLWSLEGGALGGAVGDGTAATEVLAFSTDGAWLAIGFADGRLEVFDVASRSTLRRITSLRGPVSAIAFGADGRRIVASTSDGQVEIADLESGDDLLQL